MNYEEKLTAFEKNIHILQSIHESVVRAYFTEVEEKDKKGEQPRTLTDIKTEAYKGLDAYSAFYYDKFMLRLFHSLTAQQRPTPEKFLHAINYMLYQYFNKFKEKYIRVQTDEAFQNLSNGKEVLLEEFSMLSKIFPKQMNELLDEIKEKAHA